MMMPTCRHIHRSSRTWFSMDNVPSIGILLNVSFWLSCGIFLTDLSNTSCIQWDVHVSPICLKIDVPSVVLVAQTKIDMIPSCYCRLHSSFSQLLLLIFTRYKCIMNIGGNDRTFYRRVVVFFFHCRICFICVWYVWYHCRGGHYLSCFDDIFIQ